MEQHEQPEARAGRLFVALVVTLVFGGSMPLAIVIGFAVTGLTLAVLVVSPWRQRPRSDTSG